MSARGDGREENAEEEADPRPTRTQQTRAAKAVNQLGLQLTKLSPQDLERLELPEGLRREISVSQGLKPRHRGRQNRLIGQLLRAEDHEAIRKQVEMLNVRHREELLQEKGSERWLTRLLEEGDPAIEALISAHPEADRQRLRVLTRSARQDPEAPKSKRARRELLRTIRGLRG